MRAFWTLVPIFSGTKTMAKSIIVEGIHFLTILLFMTNAANLISMFLFQTKMHCAYVIQITQIRL